MVQWVRAVTGQEDDLNRILSTQMKILVWQPVPVTQALWRQKNGSCLDLLTRIMQTRGSSIYDDTGLGL